MATDPGGSPARIDDVRCSSDTHSAAEENNKNMHARELKSGQPQQRCSKRPKTAQTVRQRK